MRSTHIILWGIGAFILLSTAACGIGGRLRGGRLGSNTLFNAGDTVYAVCSDECRASAQCGVTQTQEGTSVDVVLLSANFPASRNHDVVMQDNQQMTVVEAKVEPMLIIGTDAPFDMNYYKLRTPDGQPQAVEGWIQGTCVSTQAISR